MPLINFSGLASGIDSEALIEATTDAARATRVRPHERKISELTEESDALKEVKTFLSDLKNLANEFTTLKGGAIAKSATSSDESVLTAVASDTAQLGTYELTVSQLAKNAVMSFSERPTNLEAKLLGPGESGTIEITVGTGASEEIITVDVDEDTTWSQVAAQINEQTTKASASMVNVGTTEAPSYALVITSSSVGESSGALDFELTGDVAGAINQAEINLDQATNATFSLSGVTGVIERSSNTVSDIIPGVTFNLESVSASPVKINVANDGAATEARAKAFVDKFNEFVVYLNENNLIIREERGDNVTNIFGPLASTRLDDGALTALRNAMNSSSFEGGNEIKIFAEMGITTERDGTLAFNAATFQEALSKEPNSINQIFKKFGDTVALTNGTIDQYIRFNGLIDLSVQGNERQIKDLNERIGRAEEGISRNEEMMRARFARLESTIGRMQSQQQALTSALAGLGGLGNNN